MDAIERMLHSVGVFLSRLLSPLVRQIDRLDYEVLHQLDAAGVRGVWTGWGMTAVWVVVLFMVVRVLEGWWRLLAVVAIALVLCEVFGWFPSS